MCVKQATTVQLGLIQRRRLHVAKVSTVLLAHKPKLCVALGITRTRVVSQAANSAMLATTVMVKTRQQSKSVPAGTTAPWELATEMSTPALLAITVAALA